MNAGSFRKIKLVPDLAPRSGTNFKIRNKPGFILAGRVVMLFQSGGSYDDIRRRANACERNIWNGPNSFEAQEIFFEYAAWSVEVFSALYLIVPSFLIF